MNKDMKKDVYYWNDLYESQKVYDPKEAIAHEGIESALDWLTPKGGTVLDIGCGNGQMLLRTLEKGAIRVIGMDSSYHGISLARNASKPHYSTVSTKWVWGNLGSLLQLPDGCCQGIILSGILEYLSQEEIALVQRVIERVLDLGGRVLLITSEEGLLSSFEEEFEIVEQHQINYNLISSSQVENQMGIMVKMEKKTI